MIVQAGEGADWVRAEIDVLIKEFLDELAERVGFGEAWYLIAKLEVCKMSCTFGEKPSR